MSQVVEKILTTGEVAAICNVSQQTVIRWIDEKLLDGWKIPGSSHRRIHFSVLKKFCKRHGVPMNLYHKEESNARPKSAKR